MDEVNPGPFEEGNRTEPEKAIAEALDLGDLFEVSSSFASEVFFHYSKNET